MTLTIKRGWLQNKLIPDKDPRQQRIYHKEINQIKLFIVDQFDRHRTWGIVIKPIV